MWIRAMDPAKALTSRHSLFNNKKHISMRQTDPEIHTHILLEIDKTSTESCCPFKWGTHGIRHNSFSSPLFRWRFRNYFLISLPLPEAPALWSELNWIITQFESPDFLFPLYHLATRRNEHQHTYTINKGGGVNW